MIQYIILCMHVGCFFHARRVCTILLAAFAWVVGFLVAVVNDRGSLCIIGNFEFCVG